jgi:hypothetical protein
MTDKSRIAYTTDLSYQDPETHKFFVVKMEEDEPGYWRTPGDFDDLDAAKAHATKLNEDLGLTPDEALNIYASSMAAQMAKPGTIIATDDGPRSSCCRATMTAQKEYTDTHTYAVESCDVDDNGNVVSFTYRPVKTYDGIDGENFGVECDQCGREISTDNLDWEEL